MKQLFFRSPFVTTFSFHGKLDQEFTKSLPSLLSRFLNRLPAGRNEFSSLPKEQDDRCVQPTTFPLDNQKKRNLNKDMSSIMTNADQIQMRTQRSLLLFKKRGGIERVTADN
jgi:hypothetical protein